MVEARRGLSARWRLTLGITAVASTSAALLWAVAMLFALRYLPLGDLQRAGTTEWVPGRDAILAVFLPRSLQAWALVTIIAFAGAWWLAGRLLRPLDALVTTARAVAEGDTERRVGRTGRADEFGEVGTAFDTMLDRIDDDVRRQRRFVANASHELRTPLATTRSLLDAADAGGDAATTQLVGRLRTVNDRAEAAVNALLLLERLDNAPARTVPTDISLVAEEAVETLIGEIDARGVTLHLDARPATAHADADLLLRAVVNLIQNALVHDHGEERELWVGTRVEGAVAVLRVANTGAAIDPGEAATFIEPFRRGERVGTGTPGAGLGLALVASIVRVHGGRLLLTPRDGGGLVVDIELPAVHG